MNISRIGASQLYKVQSSSAPKLGPDSEASQVKGDSITLSSTVEHLGVARAAMDQLPDVRADKVAALKSAIKGNTYQLSPRATADGILRHAAEATGAVQPRTTES